LSSRTTRLWIGLNILNPDEGYQWSDASVVSFLNWDDGQPDTTQSTKKCGELMFNNRKYANQNCYIGRAWACQIPRGTDPTVRPIVTTELFPGNFYSYSKVLLVFVYNNFFKLVNVQTRAILNLIGLNIERNVTIVVLQFQVNIFHGRLLKHFVSKKVDF
jgi:hypothetical protein